MKTTKKTLVITIKKGGDTLIRLFDSPDLADYYKGCCRLSNAQIIVSGTLKRNATLEQIADQVVEHYGPTNGVTLAQVKTALNMDAPC